MRQSKRKIQYPVCRKFIALTLSLLLLFVQLGTDVIVIRADGAYDIFTSFTPSIVKGSTALSDGDKIYSTDSLQLNFNFEVTDSDFDSLEQQINEGGGYYRIDLYTGNDLIVSGGNAGSMYLQIPSGVATGKTFGTLCYDNGGVYIIFGGDFWTGQFKDLTSGNAFVDCQLNLNQTQYDSSHAFTFSDGTTVNLDIGDPWVDHSVSKYDYGYNPNTKQVEWEIVYTPGTMGALPIRLADTIDTTYQSYVQDTLKVTVGGSPVMLNSTNSSINDGQIEYIMNSFPSDEVVMTFCTEVNAKAFDNNNYDNYTYLDNYVNVLDNNGSNLASDYDYTYVSPDEKTWIEKEENGSYYRVGEGMYTDWIITVYTHGFDLTTLAVTDTIPADMVLKDVSVDGVLVNQSDSSVFTKTGSTFKVFISPYLQSPNKYYDSYTISYQTLIPENVYLSTNSNNLINLDETYINAATPNITWPYTYTPPQPEANVGVPINNHVIKKEVVSGYNTATHKIKWRIDINPNELDVNGGTITDILPIFQIAGGSNQSEYVHMNYVDGTFYSSNPSKITEGLHTDGNGVTPGELVINVGSIGTGSYYVTFETVADNPHFYEHNFTYTAINNADFVGTIWVGGQLINVNDSADAETDCASNVLTKSPVYKYVQTSSGYLNSYNYNYNDNTIVWRIAIDSDKTALENVVLTDDFGDRYTFVPGSLRVGTVLKSGYYTIDYLDPYYGEPTSTSLFTQVPVGQLLQNQYSVVYPNETSNTLTINFGDINQLIYVTFKTVVNTDNVPGFKDTKGTVTLENNTTLTSNSGSDTVTGTCSITNTVLGKGSNPKPTENMVSYAINIDGNRVDLKGAELTDVIPAGMKLDIYSVKLYKAVTEPNGYLYSDVYNAVTYSNIWSMGEVVPYGAGGYTFSYDLDSNEMKLTLDTTGRFVLKYDCYVTDTQKNSFTNEVTLTKEGLSNALSKAKKIQTLAGGSATSTARVALLKLVKQNSANANLKLEGVEFELWTKLNGVDTLTAVSKTNANGELTFYPVSVFGTYWLVEKSTSLSSDYKLNTAIVVSDSGNISGAGLPLDTSYFINLTASTSRTITVSNTPAFFAGVLFTKTDNSDQPLAGAEFKLTDLANRTKKYTAVSDAYGKVAFSYVPEGEYLLEETIPASGYHLINGSYKVSIMNGIAAIAMWDGTDLGTNVRIGNTPDSAPTPTPLPAPIFPVGNLRISKVFTDPADDMAVTFMVMDNSTSTAVDLTGKTISQTGGSGTFTLTIPVNGQFTQTHDTEVTIYSLPAGEYTVTEIVPNGFDAPIVSGGAVVKNGSVVQVTTGSAIMVSFENVKTITSPPTIPLTTPPITIPPTTIPPTTPPITIPPTTIPPTTPPITIPPTRPSIPTTPTRPTTPTAPTGQTEPVPAPTNQATPTPVVSVPDSTPVPSILPPPPPGIKRFIIDEFTYIDIGEDDLQIEKGEYNEDTGEWNVTPLITDGNSGFIELDENDLQLRKWEYDEDTGVWNITPLPPLPIDTTLFTDADGFIELDENDLQLKKWEYNEDTGEWNGTPLPPLPIGTTLYIIVDGFIELDDNDLQIEKWEYDEDAGVWNATPLPPLPIGTTLIPIANGGFIELDENNFQVKKWEYFSGTGKWTAVLLPPLPISTTLIPDEKGGYIELDSNGVMIGTWSYNEADGTWVLTYGQSNSIPQTGTIFSSLNVLLLAAIGFLMTLFGFLLKKIYEKKKKA